jgi:DNA-binding winged helix-turn-helix (wHTH) protein/TolB-like protein/Flp pilus assembly protein TadD
MVHETKEIVEFGRFRLDRAQALLTREGIPVPLPPKIFDLLVYLVSNAGRLVEKDELIRALWPDSFVEEANLTVNIAALRKALGPPPEGESWIETVPKRGYRFAAPVRRVEMPGAGPPDLKNVERSAPRRGRIRVVVAVLFVTVVSVFIYVRRPFRSTADQRVSIAVLPFHELPSGSGDPQIGVGMADALITKLATLPQLTVRPVANVLKYDGADIDFIAAGRALGVDTVLCGSIQRIDKRIRVTVRLLRVQDSQSLWADKFDEFYNLFAVQDAISEKLANVLALRLTSEDQERMLRRYTESTEAFRLYELGRHEHYEHGAIALQRFEEAIAADPRYALPHVEIATIYLGISGNGRAAYEKYASKARQSAETALRLAPDLAEAHVAAADVKRILDRDFGAADRELDAALRLNRGSAKAHISRANMLAMEGDLTGAVAEAHTALDLDPFNAEFAGDLAWMLYCSRQYEGAVRWLDEFKQRDPREHIDWNRFYCYLKLSRIQDAAAIMQTALQTYGPNRSVSALLAHAYALAGRTAEARELLRQLGDDWGFYQRAVVDLTLGDRTAALAHLNQAVDEHNVFIQWLKVDPDMDRCVEILLSTAWSGAWG